MNRVPGAWNIGAWAGISDSDAQILYFVGSLVLAAALLVITTYYTLQNKRMVAEMRRQNRPYVYIVWERDSLRLRNSGSRSARNVRLKIIKDASLTESIVRADGESRVIGIRTVSESDACRLGVPAILPGGDRIIGEAMRAGDTPQSLEYILAYEDGSGGIYQESGAEEYSI